MRFFFIEDPNRTDISTMVNYIKARYEVPHCFRRSFTSKIRKLVSIETLRRRITITRSRRHLWMLMQIMLMTTTKNKWNLCCTLPREKQEDAALVGTYRVSIALNTEQEAIRACKKEAMFAKLLDES